MKRITTTLTILALTALPGAATAACGTWPRVIEAFTDSAHPIEGVEALAAQMPNTRILIRRIDGKAEFDAKLSEGLPADPVEAERIARERIARVDPREVEAAMASALDSAGRMVNYGITRVPTVVFDGRGAIVGEPDVRKALDAYCRRGP
jgi:integrating conjugative element protein (TIGR03757 family)